jgi:hypothetical protein
MNYRFDNRSKEQFKREIKESTLRERTLFLLWISLIEHETGKRPNFRDVGCGNDGEYLEDSQVSTDPDFWVDGYGQIEVKFSKPLLTKTFHLKANQVKSYLKKNAAILMVNGADSDAPTFTILKPKALKNIMKSCEIIPWTGFGGKQSYRIPVDMFVWRSLCTST